MVLPCHAVVHTMWNVPSGPRTMEGSRMSFDSPTSGLSSGRLLRSGFQVRPSALDARYRPSSPLPRKKEKSSASSLSAAGAARAQASRAAGRSLTFDSILWEPI